MSFYVYENWVHKYAKVHRADCVHCNHGRGTHAAGNSRAGRWHGDYTYPEALRVSAATGFYTTDCAVCAPS